MSTSITIEAKMHSAMWLRQLILVSVVGLTIAPVQAASSVRSSASYAVQFDSIGAGGGLLSSASYRQAPTAAAHEPAWAVSSSASYNMQTGAVLWGSFVPVTLSSFHIE